MLLTNYLPQFNRSIAYACFFCLLVPILGYSQQDSSLPIADAHVHYSHDSVEMTPPARVIEIMREANLKFALVSSSDDNGTQLLNELAPDLVIPGLRPYRQRGETGTWFTDPDALAYVEALLAKNKYASIGEFHLYGDDAQLEIPRRIVELAEEYNLILHAHSDAEAVEQLLAQSETVRVIWAHSGFDTPEEISEMLSRHDRLWADLAFRSEVGSGGLSKAWRKLFEDHPDRMMLGTDTYTPERMYFIPEHAASARVWLNTLPEELAVQVAWKNAYDLIMPIWQKNKAGVVVSNASGSVENKCASTMSDDSVVMENDHYKVILTSLSEMQVSQPTSVSVTVCGNVSSIDKFSLDASMPMHGHGTNYKPSITAEQKFENSIDYIFEGVVLHMPGTWQWDVEIASKGGTEKLMHKFVLE